jgi:hypothetical protein
MYTYLPILFSTCSLFVIIPVFTTGPIYTLDCPLKIQSTKLGGTELVNQPKVEPARIPPIRGEKGTQTIGLQTLFSTKIVSQKVSRKK